MKHIPILRFGTPYESLDQSNVIDHRNGEVLATVSIANGGVLRKDLRGMNGIFRRMQEIPQADLSAMCKKAADIFMNDEAPQSVDEYVRVLSLTSGLPHTLCRANMEKIAYVLRNIDYVLEGLSRGLDLSILDAGFRDGLSYFPNTNALGVILPSNSPGVNSLYLPTIALKVPLLLKPGREEPWTPFRVIQSFVQAGVPADFFGFYPATHEGSGVILEKAGRCILFGDKKVANMYSGNSGISVHGPGYSKIVIGEDEIDNWESHVDLIVQSMVAGGGRSCICASTIVVPRHAEAIGKAVAERLDAIKPVGLEDPNARLSAFAKKRVGNAINGMLDSRLGDGASGARCLTVTDRAVEVEDSLYLRPALVHCTDRDHPLAKTEFLFPYASIVEIPQAEAVDYMGPSLVVAAVTKDPAFTRELLSAPTIQRLNLGNLPTTKVEWNQPHEGNLFEFLYSRRAISMAS